MRNKALLSLLFFSLFVISISNVYAIAPVENYAITTAGEYVFDAGTYALNDSDSNGVIQVQSSNVIIRCNETVFQGNDISNSFGIKVWDGMDNITIDGCTFYDYSYAIGFFHNHNGITIKNNKAYSMIWNSYLIHGYNISNVIIDNNIGEGRGVIAVTNWKGGVVWRWFDYNIGYGTADLWRGRTVDRYTFGKDYSIIGHEFYPSKQYYITGLGVGVKADQPKPIKLSLRNVSNKNQVFKECDVLDGFSVWSQYDNLGDEYYWYRCIFDEDYLLDQSKYFLAIELETPALTGSVWGVADDGDATTDNFGFDGSVWYSLGVTNDLTFVVDSEKIKNIQITNNYITNGGENAIELSGAENGIIKNNTILGAYFDYTNVYMRVYSSRNTLIEDNEIHGTTGTHFFGLWSHGDVTPQLNITVRNNIITDSYIGLAVVQQTFYSLVDSNQVYNNKAGIYALSWSENGTFIHNNASNNQYYGLVVAYSSDYNWFEENTFLNNGQDIALYMSNWNTGCGNVYDTIWEINAFGNNISKEPCPVVYPEPTYDYKTPKDLIIHVVKTYPETTPYCVNCEIQNGHQTGVVFYIMQNCAQVEDECQVWDYWGLLNKTKLLTIDNDVCANYTQIPTCGTPITWKARGKATWVYHNLGTGLQPLISKYSDELGLNTEFDGKTNKHKIKDDDGVVSESDDVYIADYKLQDSELTFYIANNNSKTIWADKIQVENLNGITPDKSYYTTHSKKKIDVILSYDSSTNLITITPLDPKDKIPIEPATGSNILIIQSVKFIGLSAFMIGFLVPVMLVLTFSVFLWEQVGGIKLDTKEPFKVVFVAVGLMVVLLVTIVMMQYFVVALMGLV